MNILIPFTILIVSWSIDSSDPDIQQFITYIFLAVHAIALLCLVYLSIAVYRCGQNTPVQVKDSYTGEIETKKYWEYDASKVRELFFTKIGLSAAVSLFVASRYGMPFPLLLQCLNNPKAIYDSEIFQIYALGREATGELQRPWKENSIMPEWMKGLWNQGTEDTEAFVDKHRGGGPSAAKKK